MPKNPHADFTPTLAGYSGITPFRFWCQTALPLTYDDSLSYYELLNKVVNYLNLTIEDLTNVENNTSELAEAYDKLQKYVNDYFDDIDIEAELRNVLDGMAEDGTLDALLDPLVANRLPGVVEDQISGVVAEQIDSAVEGQIDDVVGEQLPPLVDANIGEEVSDWLEENVTPVGSAVLVDSTLSIGRAAADAKVTGEKIYEIEDVVNDIDVSVNGGYRNNFTENKIIMSDGSVVDDETNTFSVSDKIPYTWMGAARFYTGLSSDHDCRIAFYDANDALLNAFTAPNTDAEYRSINAESQVTGTVAYCRFSFFKNYAAKVQENVNTQVVPYWSVESGVVSGLISDLNSLESDVDGLDDRIDLCEEDIDANAENISEINEILYGSSSTNYSVNKTIAADGSVENDPTNRFSVSDKIPYTWTGSTRYYTGLSANKECKIAFYDENDTLLQAFTAPNTDIEYRAINAENSVTGTIAYCRFSFNNGYAAKVQANVNTPVEPYWTAESTTENGVIDNLDDLLDENIAERLAELEESSVREYGTCIEQKVATLTTGTFLEIGENIDTRKNDIIEFRGYITEFTSVSVGHGHDLHHSMFITVDDTYVKLYDYEYDNNTGTYAATEVDSREHNLTFNYFIGVLINRSIDGNTFVEINSDTGLYKWENVNFNDASRGKITAFCTGTLTDVTLNAVYKDFNTPIYVFGDSYQSIGSSIRYPYYLFENGYYNYLMAGFPGANSAHGYAALTAILERATPKYIVWCLGMNNSDTENAINDSYKTVLDNVLALCEEKGIIPVLCTIPNTPTRRHTYKNSYVKSLGVRYIDFAKAVGAENYPSTWYTGMLEENSDPTKRVHPTALGAKSLYSQFITDFPEITN